MGHITGDMTRLVGEIRALRDARNKLIEDLTRGAKDLKDAVSAMLANFSNAHAAMARKTKAERMAFLSGLNNAVAGMRKEFAADLAGARLAWFGHGA